MEYEFKPNKSIFCFELSTVTVYLKWVGAHTITAKVSHRIKQHANQDASAIFNASAFSDVLQCIKI